MVDLYLPSRRQFLISSAVVAGALVPSDLSIQPADSRRPPAPKKYDVKFEIADGEYLRLMDSLVKDPNGLQLADELKPTTSYFSGTPDGIRAKLKVLQENGVVKAPKQLDDHLKSVAAGLLKNRNFIDENFNALAIGPKIDEDHSVIVYRYQTDSSTSGRYVALIVKARVSDKGAIEPVALDGFTAWDYAHPGNKSLGQIHADQWNEEWGSKNLSVNISSQGERPKRKWTDLVDLTQTLMPFAIIPEIDIEGRWAALSEGIPQQNLKKIG